MTIDSRVFEDNKYRKISPKQFFGPYFEFESKRPVISGVSKCGSRIYTYYDKPPIEENNLYPWELSGYGFYEYATQGYTKAFFESPHINIVNSFNSRYEAGQFFLDFNDEIFTDINTISIYEWDINCSNYFDYGKKNGGSYFWTIYNPIRNLYIGILY